MKLSLRTLLTLGLTSLFLYSPRPMGIFANPETFSMPSGHTTLATTAFMGLAFLIAKSMRPRYRGFVYFLGLLICFIVGVSRLYLGAHWFTDVVCAWLLSASVLMFVIISYEREPEAPINPGKLLLATLLSFIVTFAFYHYTQIDKLKTNYAIISLPSVKIAMNEWWGKNDALPAYRVSLFGFPSQVINVVWAGNINDINQSLIKQGWEKPPARDWISTLHRIADIKSTQYLSMISPQYLDKKPELIFARHSKSDKGLMVLRLWYANRLINETGEPIWVGSVGFVPRTYNWLFRSHPGEIKIDPAYIFPLNTKPKEWEWKIITMNQPTGTRQNIKQKNYAHTQSTSSQKIKGSKQYVISLYRTRIIHSQILHHSPNDNSCAVSFFCLNCQKQRETKRETIR